MEMKRPIWSSGEIVEAVTAISAIPYAGIIQIRFNGYHLRHSGHPLQKRTCEYQVYRKNTPVSIPSLSTVDTGNLQISAVSRPLEQDFSAYPLGSRNFPVYRSQLVLLTKT